MGNVHVTDFVTGSFPGQTAGPQSGQTAFVGQFSQRVVLVHELGQLAAAEEFLHGGHHRTDVDQSLGRDHIGILESHPFPDHPFHTAQTDPELVLEQFPYAADTPVAQVVDIVLAFHAVDYVQQVSKGSDYVSRGDHPDGRIDVLGHDHLFRFFLIFHPDFRIAGLAVDAALFNFVDFFITDDGAGRQDHFAPGAVGIFEGNGRSQFFAQQALAPAQFLVDLVPAHIGQVIPPVVGEDVLDQLGGVFQVGRFARTEFPVDFQQGIFFVLGGILGQGSHQERMFPEGLDDVIVGGQPHDTEQCRCRQFPGPVHTGIDDVVQIGFIFDPGTPVGDDRGPVEKFPHGIHVFGIIHTGRTDQLADDDPFRPVDHEGTGIGHQGEVPHEYSGFLDFARIFVQQTDVHIQRSRIGGVLFLAGLDIVFGIPDGEVFKTQFQVVRKILDGRNVFENVVQSFSYEPLIRFSLQVDQMRHLQDFFDPSITVPDAVAIMYRLKHVVSHSFSLGRYSKKVPRNLLHKKNKAVNTIKIDQPCILQCLSVSISCSSPHLSGNAMSNH